MVGAPLSQASRGTEEEENKEGREWEGCIISGRGEKGGGRFLNERRQSWGKAKQRGVEADRPTVPALISSADSERENVKAD